MFTNRGDYIEFKGIVKKIKSFFFKTKFTFNRSNYRLIRIIIEDLNFVFVPFVINITYFVTNNNIISIKNK